MLNRLAWLLVMSFQAWTAWAGGSGLNVIVVVNQNSANSLQLGNEYCEQRSVPPQNIFRMTNWNGGATAWSLGDFEGYLRDPLFNKLAHDGLSNQVSYVLLSMDIPYHITDGISADSTTSALFYGFKSDTPTRPDLPLTCSLPDSASNSFAFSESPFELARPDTAMTNSFLTFMLTAESLSKAEAILSRGVASDSTAPTQTVYLEKTSDSARNVRFYSFDNAILNSLVRGDVPLARINSDSTAFHNSRGLLTGLITLSLPSDAFVAGGLGDSLTSFAGDLFGNTGQTPLLAFLNAGAAASYGTVVEPCNYPQKFPDPMAFIYQNRGFCAAEAYYQSVLHPYQGLFVGEPLSAPFAIPGDANWQALTNGTVVSGNAILPPALFTGVAGNSLVSQVDLFIDGVYARTLTNVAPSQGTLALAIDGSQVEYVVPPGASLLSVSRGLAEALNSQSNTTHVAAANRGDRIELQGLDVSVPGSNIIASVGDNLGSSLSLSSARSNFVDTISTGYLGLIVTNATVPGDWLALQVTKTNGTSVTISVTNSGSTVVADLCQSLLTAINSSAELQENDGIVAGELYPDINLGQFFLYARSPGWPAAKVQANLSASPNLIVSPAGNHTFEDNISDLRPRNHVYLSCGWAQISTGVILDTSHLADGFHELTLVAYDGTSVRTQTHVSRMIQVRNGSLSAELLLREQGTNFSVDAPASLTVAANNTNIAKIELFSSGGLLDAVSNVSTNTFSVPVKFLGVGVHPFYALVTDKLGQEYRTPTLMLRFVPSLLLTISVSPSALSWSSVPGVSYDVLASTDLKIGFQKVGSVIASDTTSQWLIPSGENQVFYRIRAAP